MRSVRGSLECDIRPGDLEQETTTLCYSYLKLYLEASYECIRGEWLDRCWHRCKCWVTYFPTYLLVSSYVAVWILRTVLKRSHSRSQGGFDWFDRTPPQPGRTPPPPPPRQDLKCVFWTCMLITTCEIWVFTLFDTKIAFLNLVGSVIR